MVDDREVLQRMVEKAQQLLVQAARVQRQANDWAETMGEESPFPAIVSPDAAHGSASLRPDHFRSHTTPGAAARAYLTIRGQKRGAATLDEIFEALEKGGYAFSGSEREAKNSLKIALGKDTGIDKLASGHYGLLAWYGAKRERNSKDKIDSQEENSGAGEPGQEPEDGSKEE